MQHAVPDARFHYDFACFAPDFRNSAAAMERVVALPCYQAARTILATPDNSLEPLRARALRDGKQLLVATYKLRRGFVLLHPGRISEARYDVAACLDGMEKAGTGRAVTLAQMRDQGLQIDLCVTGGLVFTSAGVVVREAPSLFEMQWALLHDVGALRAETRVVAVAHGCQVVDEAHLSIEPTMPRRPAEVQCDYLVTPEATLQVTGATRPTGGIDFDTVDPHGLQDIPTLQELRGIRIMEKIMQREGFLSGHEAKSPPPPPSQDEQRGIDIVNRLMQSFKS